MIFPQKEAGQISPDFGSTWQNLDMDYFRPIIKAHLNPSCFPQKFRQILGQHGKISILTTFALIRKRFNPFNFPWKFRQILGQYERISILTSFALVSSIWSITQFRQFLGQHPFKKQNWPILTSLSKKKNQILLRSKLFPKPRKVVCHSLARWPFNGLSFKLGGFAINREGEI